MYKLRRVPKINYNNDQQGTSCVSKTAKYFVLTKNGKRVDSFLKRASVKKLYPGLKYTYEPSEPFISGSISYE
jgi:hypothetical protein